MQAQIWVAWTQLKPPSPAFDLPPHVGKTPTPLEHRAEDTPGRQHAGALHRLKPSATPRQTLMVGSTCLLLPPLLRLVTAPGMKLLMKPEGRLEDPALKGKPGGMGS